MKNIYKLVLILGVLFLKCSLLGAAAEGMQDQKEGASKASRIIQKKFSKVNAPLDDSHPAMIAARKANPSMQEEIVKFCHVFQNELNIVVGWFLHDVFDGQKRREILTSWHECPVAQRPILTSGKLFNQEVINIEKLEEYLKDSWQESPLVICDDYHTIAVQIKVENKEVHA